MIKYTLHIFILIFFCSNGYAQSRQKGNTLKNLIKPENNISYKERSNDKRREGMYRKEYASGSLEIVSCTYGPVYYELRVDEVLKIECPKGISKSSSINVTGINFKMNKYYRMDMELAPGQQKKIPIKEVIRPENIATSKLGIYGYLGDIESPSKYIPLKVSSNVQNATDEVQILFVVDRTMKEISWQWASTSDGSCGVWSDKTILKSGPIISSDQPIVFMVPRRLLMKHQSEVCFLFKGIPVGNADPIELKFTLLIP